MNRPKRPTKPLGLVLPLGNVVMRTIPIPMRTDELDFDLPKRLIATRPAEPRDSSRLLVVQRSNPDRLEHRVFADLPDLLAPRDLLVFNRSRVVPARLVGHKPSSGGRFEGLFLSELHLMDDGRPQWVAMVKAKRAKPGKVYELFTAEDTPSAVTVELLAPHEPDGPGAWRIAVSGSDLPTHGILERVGRTPLPPYILTQRRERDEDQDDRFDRSHYQTVYAHDQERGSVAAPTAGLHFTPAVLGALAARSVDTTHVTLHVGAGTFRPVETDTLAAHPMHSERCALGPAAAHFPPSDPDRRVFAVGSTSARTLESYAQLQARDPAAPLPAQHDTDILIAPGHQWRWVQGMVTNFHLPRSTLLAMVASMLDIPGQTDGLARVHEIYAQAIAHGYRFFSYGDAMLILP